MSKTRFDTFLNELRAQTPPLPEYDQDKVDEAVLSFGSVQRGLCGGCAPHESLIRSVPSRSYDECPHRGRSLFSTQEVNN